MDRSPVRDFVVGLFVLAGIGAVAYLSIAIGGFSFRGHEGLKLTADFNETGDLVVRAPVAIAGVRVGEITSITLLDNFQARVAMDLDPGLKLPADTSASIVTAGMLGDRYVELQPGGEEKLLKSGDQIAFRESAVILEKLIGQLVYSISGGDKKDTKPDAGAAATQKTP